MSPATRLLVGGLAAAVIALAARRARSLSRSGALAATATGAMASMAGVEWAMLLVVFFVATSALSRLGAAAKGDRTAWIVQKPGPRDWRQVAANGGVFTIAAAWWTFDQHTAAAALGAGSLAAAAADSWATEIGTLSRTAPRSIATFRVVPAGTSGGITIAGTTAMIAGATFIGVAAWGFGWGLRAGIAATAAGIAGAVVDSLLGALLQSRRWCPACRVPTEQLHHGCGVSTRPAGGISWLDNDAVNLTCSTTGGLLAALLTT